jgi:hypothetical protein
VPAAVGVSDLVPLVDCDPLQSPLAVHAVALVEDQVRVALPPSVMVAGATEISAVGAAGAVTVNVADCLALPPAPVQVRVYASLPVAVGVSVAVPLVAWVPLHAPLAVQDVAFVEDQVRVAVAPRTIEVGLTDIVTVGTGGALTDTVANALALPPLPLQVRV